MMSTVRRQSLRDGYDEFGFEQRRYGGYGEAILIAVAIAGAATAAYGTYKQGQDAAAASKYNEKLAFMEADQAKAAAKIKGEQQAELDRRAQAGVRARIGASGVTEEGSPLLVLAEYARQAQLDQERIKYGGEITAQGLEARARLQGAYAGFSRESGAVGAGASLLGSASRLATAYNTGAYRPRSAATVPE